MALSPREMIEAVTRNLKAQSGKTLAEWRAVAKKDGPKEPKALEAWLKSTHGLKHVQSKIVAGSLMGGHDYDQPDALVDKQYAGPKAKLRPIYDAVLRAVRTLGKDVTVKPCGTYVPIHRSKTFALVKATTATRVDLGLVLPGARLGGRLTRAAHLGSDRITHKVSLTSPKELDAEVLGWLQRAYEEA